MKRLFFLIIIIFAVQIVQAQIRTNERLTRDTIPQLTNDAKPSQEYLQKIRKRYRKNEYNEISLKEYVKISKQNYKADLETKRYLDLLKKDDIKLLNEDACLNGDLTSYTPINISTLCPNGMQQIIPGWWFGMSQVDYSTGNVSSYPITPQAFGCVFDRAQMASTIFGPYVSPPPNSPPLCLKIGNDKVGAQADIAVRKVKVDYNTKLISFWYATVFDDPPGNHADHQRPSFSVVVYDQAGNAYTNLANLGNGSNTLISKNNPFFETATVDPNGPHDGLTILYRDWTCAQVDLSRFPDGEEVEVHSSVEDCSHGGHFGYAYIDDFCSNCSGDDSGNISFEGCTNQKEVCIDYDLPTRNSSTGSVELVAEIFQNGNLITTYTSPVLNSGSNFCFPIECEKMPSGFDSSKGYDIVCTGNFKLGSSSLGSKIIGVRPEGVKQGNNNDCACAGEIQNFDPCCPPISKQSMVDLFVHTSMGGINGDYRIEFVPTTSFKNAMQAYTDLLNLTCGASGLYFSWNLDEITGFGGNSISNIEKEYFHFINNGNGVIQNNPSFFNDPGKECSPGKYYRIRVGVYPNNQLDCFDAGKCSASFSFEYYVQIVGRNNSPKLIINGMPNKSLKMNTRNRRN